MQSWLPQKINPIEIQNDLAKLRGMIFNDRASRARRRESSG
jgi:hypothetical protein